MILGIEPLVHKLIELASATPDEGISFHDYMGQCLYHPEFGYYNQEQIKIGKSGDFYTSSSIGTIMGEMLAAYILRQMDKTAERAAWNIVEWGGGNGRLASHILQELKKLSPERYENLTYIMIEQSEYHQQLQQNMLEGHREKVRFTSADEWFARADETYTCVLSNELLDAFPVHRVQFAEQGWHEIRVIWDEQKQGFVERLVPLNNPKVSAYIQALGMTQASSGQIIEINLQAFDWIKRAASRLGRGLIITIDYGDITKELCSVHRMKGTLMCYRRHQAHDNPYVNIGEQDITSHVNFSACMLAGEEGGIEEQTLQTQSEFLVGAGILDKLRNHSATDPFSPEARYNRTIRQLLLSDGMSELFKVLIQHKRG